MVDCRLCLKHYTIYRTESDAEENIYVCLVRKCIIPEKDVRSGDCDVYMDRDDA